MTDAPARVGPRAPQPGAAPRPPWVVWLGLGVVLLAAAALSFEAIQALALAVGIGPRLAWLLPITVDAGAAVSCAVWLGGRSPDDAARFAGRMTWALLGVTVLGNAGQLGMHAYGITPPWLVAALVGAIAPAVVGSVVHLVVLLTRRPADEVVVAAEPVRGEIEVVAIESAADEDELLPKVREWIAEQPGAPSQRQLRSEFGVGAERARRLLEAAA
jgi:hypothetical protein